MSGTSRNSESKSVCVSGLPSGRTPVFQQRPPSGGSLARLPATDSWHASHSGVSLLTACHFLFIFSSPTRPRPALASYRVSSVGGARAVQFIWSGSFALKNFSCRNLRELQMLGFGFVFFKRICPFCRCAAALAFYSWQCKRRVRHSGLGRASPHLPSRPFRSHLSCLWSGVNQRRGRPGPADNLQCRCHSLKITATLHTPSPLPGPEGNAGQTAVCVVRHRVHPPSCIRVRRPIFSFL